MYNYWIVVLSKDSVQECIKGHYVQSANGKKISLERMRKGDKIIFYSPKQSLKTGERCQAFTGLATIADDEIYQVELTSENKPYRRDVLFEKTSEVQIIPLIQKLSFIRSKSRWGEIFRLDLILLPPDDYKLIQGLMQQEKMK